jgi:hypothetical protein
MKKLSFRAAFSIFRALQKTGINEGTSQRA